MKYSIHDDPLPSQCPVVYLPGIDGTGRLLHRQRRLQEQYQLHCLSYPQLTRHTYADLVTLAIRQLKHCGPSVVLAESFGGAVALMTALARPEWVRRLVLVNTFAYYPRRFTIDCLSLLGPWLPTRPSPPNTRRLRGRFFFSAGTSEAEQDAWWDLTADVPMRAYGNRFRMIHDLDLRERLPEITIPALVFVAPNDWIVPPPAGRLLAKRLPQASLIECPVSHAALIDPRIDIAQWLHEWG